MRFLPLSRILVSVNRPRPCPRPATPGSCKLHSTILRDGRDFNLFEFLQHTARRARPSGPSSAPSSLAPELSTSTFVPNLDVSKPLARAAPPEIFLLRPLSLDDALIALPTCPFPAPRHNFAPSRGTNANLSRANSESNSLDLWASVGRPRPARECLSDGRVCRGGRAPWPLSTLLPVGRERQRERERRRVW